MAKDPADPKAAIAAPQRSDAASSVRLVPTAFTPLVDEDGAPIRKIAPYLPILRACDVCPARCCRLNVKVSLPDVIRYCTTLGVPFFAGMTIVPSLHELHGFLLDRDERFVDADDGWTGRAEIQLRRREDGGCHGLVEVGGYERCGVYAARPGICRLYPISWESDVARGGPEAVLCPVPYGVTPEAEAELKLDVQDSIDRWKMHEDVVLLWNESAAERKLEGFVEFAIKETGERLGVDVADVLAVGWPEQRMYQKMLDAKIVRSDQRIFAPPGGVNFAGLPPAVKKKS